MAQDLRFQSRYDAHVRAHWQRWGESLERLDNACQRIRQAYGKRLDRVPIGQDDFLDEVEWLASVAEVGQ